MQRILLGFLALFFFAACTPKATTTMADKADDMVDKTMQDDFRAKAPAPGPATEIELGDFQDFKLDNGLQVILVENHKLPRVSYQLFIDVPPHMEGEYAGASGMMGSMLRRATSDMTKAEIDEAVDFIGASLSTSGSGAFASTISKYKKQMMELMGKVVLDARFPAEEFSKVKEDAQAGFKANLASPDAIASRVRQVLTYGKDHPYGELTTEETLENVTLDVVKNYYDTYFVPNRSYLVMVGDLTRKEAEMMAMETFGSWEKKTVPTPSFDMPASPEGVVVNFVPRAGSVQSILNVTHPIDLKPGTKAAIQAGIVNSILGSGSSGRLFQNLREDKGYTYGAYSNISNNRLVGNFNASTSVRNEVTDSAVQQLMLEIAKIGAEPVTTEELNRAKSQLNGSFGRALESPQRIASYALSTIRYGLSRDFYPTYLQKVEATTAADLQMMGKKYIATGGTNIIVVGDKAVAEKLAQFASNGKVNYYDANGEPMDMDAMAAPTDVTPKGVLEAYLTAIGGMDAIKSVKSIDQTMEANIQGQTITQTFLKADGDKFSSQTKMMGMVMMDQRYNGGKAKMVQQGAPMEATEEMISGLKEQAVLFPTVALMDKLDEITVSGTEMIEGKKAIILDVPVSGTTAQFYFDADSKLLVRLDYVPG
ncbi:MAG: pitrilysin family protein, partial [Bacteroidota bacterium]